VSQPTAKKSVASHRLTAVVLLLAVFALPFHFHFFTPTAKLSQECSCYQGARSQTGLAPALSDWTPAFHASFIVLHEPQVVGRLSFGSRAIRAPPRSISL
jgi:hypothetical protein